jgi:predicted nucleic acid-binding Zn ribbon protein
MTKKRYNISSVKPAYSIISEVMGSSPWIKDGMTLGAILNNWELIAGDNHKSLKPVELKNGKLLIQVPDSVWLNDVQYYKEDLRTKINQFLGSEIVKELKFYIK